MALGALAANPSLDLKIVTCGLNYFHPHRFRSRAVVEFGEPLTVPPELVEMYKRGGADKREACGKLLDTIYDALKNVTLNSPDYETLMVRYLHFFFFYFVKYSPRNKLTNSLPPLFIFERF